MFIKISGSGYISDYNSIVDTANIETETAIAICQQVGITGLASSCKKAASALVMQAAVDCQPRAESDLGRWDQYVANTIAAIRSTTAAAHIQSAGLLKGITGKGDKLATLIKRASTTFENYTKRVEAAWKQGLLIETAKGAEDGSVVPGETLHTLNERTKAAEAAKCPVTEQMRLKARMLETFNAVAALVDSPKDGDAVTAWASAELDGFNDRLGTLVASLQGQAPAPIKAEPEVSAPVETLPEAKPGKPARAGRKAA